MSKHKKTIGEYQVKKTVLFIMIFVMTLSLASCGAAEKEFSGSGMNVTLDETFIEKDVIQAPVYLESQKYIFMGIRETISSLSPYGIDDLESYVEAVLANNNHPDVDYQSMLDDEGNVLYYYAYYNATVEDMDFGYMLVAMEGETHYYTMNFGCLEDDLESSKDQFFTWAKTITVE